MTLKCVKSLLVAGFSLFFLAFSISTFAQEKPTETGDNVKKEEKNDFDANEVIFGHILDAHEFHFFSYEGSDGEEHEAAIPLPVILYSKQKGLDVFMFSQFHHGEAEYDGYKLITAEMLKEENLPEGKYHEGQIVAVDANGQIDESVKLYDFSITRYVVQMIISVLLLTWIMVSIANRYKKGHGVVSAPKGKQSLMEPVILFIVDEVAKPCLGEKNYRKYLPFLLTVFFFILINNLLGLIPGSANVTGNIAFTLVLALIAFVAILFSTNKHYWGHIFNPPVPAFVKPILMLVEFLGVFIKPMALMIRLFANMVAGHILVICLISLIFIFAGLGAAAGWGASPLSVAFTIFIYFIEILVAFLQAYIFVFLSAVFIGQAFEGGHNDVDHHEDAVIV
ncbi:F0F1 ATP synthase subunit A [Parafilimonas terrae]|uniref:ATP synthase subunit a n=1 Tax=Parafilimonas terrae TaxID=1465490 RepID=A0A1I5S0B4_9BACT|nr:F0F1 ATP synthase subunit A [Parafilimonas terrae]SFP64094.1 ATP synthase F0 subcomplex A subunit [Parafilimonas terrae]